MNTTKVLLDSPITIAHNDKSETKLISYPKGWVEMDNADLNDPFIKAHIVEIIAQPYKGKEDPPNNPTNADQEKSQLKAGGKKGETEDKNGDNQGK